jgi:uncharacterized protein (DUF924 family)
MSITTQTIIDFWFEELDPKQWWVKDVELDNLIRDRFGEIHQQANRCELAPWRHNARGRLAEIIILDQFSRNIYRDTPHAFASDALALCLTQHAINHNSQIELEDVERQFLYMPFMHSESIVIHQVAERFFNEPQVSNNKEFERRHRIIIEQFGRYPHRNDILGRQSTNEELEFLKQPGSSF